MSDWTVFTQACCHCGQMIFGAGMSDGSGRWWHPSCEPRYFQPLPITEERIREIAREEIRAALAEQGAPR